MHVEDKPPAVTVLMAVHNGSTYVRLAIESVLQQSFHDFEFVIVDDASFDQTPEILQDYSRKDRRIRIFQNASNLGLTRSLNTGLNFARGKYIARIDADDICRNDRLLKQFDVMERIPSLTIIGCGSRIIDEDGQHRGTTSEHLNPDQIRWLLGFTPPCYHPTYFFRRLQPDGTQVLYDPAFGTAQDFDLWSRLAKIGPTQVLPDTLIDYRRHPNGISSKRRPEQASTSAAILRRNLRDRLPPDVLDAITPLVDLLTFRTTAQGTQIDRAVHGLEVLLAQDREFFTSHAERKWMHQTAAALLADAILSRGGALHRPNDLLRFIWKAYRFLPGLARAIYAQPAKARKALRFSSQRT